MKKVLNNLGLCARSRNLVSGESLVIDAISSKQAHLVLIANDCEKNTYKKLNDKCKFYNTQIIELPFDRYELGRAIGKEFRVCVAVTDKGFKQLILKNIKE